MAKKEIVRKVRENIDAEATRIINDKEYSARMLQAGAEVHQVKKKYSLQPGFFVGFTVALLRQQGVTREEAEALFDECWKVAPLMGRVPPEPEMAS